MQGRADIRSAILRHLARHPDVKGTLESITEWWILEQRIDQCLTEVDSALRQLVDEGVVIEQPRINMPTLYEVNEQRLDEIRDMLERH